jgi:hypothetical protein
MSKARAMPTKKNTQDDIRKQVTAGRHARTKLRTDERVLARITDGIYRQPASALRELIFNAYDADAESVWIQTDAPRFSQVVVQDDGNGMTLDVLEHLVHHIGGSSKRTKEGISMGIADPYNQKSSPGGRKLIGKIGIGLFSVAQLTRHFQIITKPKNEAFRYIADIRLKTYSEDQLETMNPGTKPDFQTGDVEIWREPAADKETHGTQIVLLELKEHSRSLLQSRERWIRTSTQDAGVDELVRPAPAYHIGSVDPKTQDIRKDTANLPWDEVSDEPAEKFRKLYQAVLDQVELTASDPTLENTFDNYLNMMWTLALSSPVKYVDQHPFDITGKDDVRVFVLSNKDREPARELTLRPKQTVRQAAKLAAVEKGPPFAVFIDGVELLRPIRFRKLPTKSKSKLTTPLLFVAKCSPDLKGVPKDATGGQALSFEGYFFWAPKVVPKENNGVILRIGNATGALFDDTFMHYEVSEQTRLRQITAELFVAEGLDAALNIDRESFNYSHPHYQFISRWIYRALRQLATRHKALGSDAIAESRTQDAAAAQQELRSVVAESFAKTPEKDEEPPEVVFVDNDQSPEAKTQRRQGALVFRKEVLDEYPKGTKAGAKREQKKEQFEDKLKAVAQILDGYGLLKRLSYQQQEELLRAVARVFLAGGGP